MTTDERIKTIRDALLPLDDAWDALNSLVVELDAARAREAKLREALDSLADAVEGHQAHAWATSDIDTASARAALAEGEDRLCASCQCRHSKDVMCPPHEMRYSAEDTRG